MIHRGTTRRRVAIAESLGAAALPGAQAADNYYTLANSTSVAAQTIAAGPTSVNVAAILLTPRFSGIFRIDCDVGYSSNTNAHPVTWTLNANQATVVGNTWAIGGTPLTQGFGGNGTAASTTGVVNSASAAMGITIVGGSTNLSLDQKIIAPVTGLLTASGSASQYYGVHGIFGSNSARPDGRQVAFIVNVNATAGDVITIPTLQLSIQELPWA